MDILADVVDSPGPPNIAAHRDIISVATSTSAGVDVQDEGTPVLTPANTLNFTGAGVTASNVGGVAQVNIPGITTIPGLAVVRKAATETVTANNALQDDNELFFAIAASETWVAEFHLYVQASTTFSGNITLGLATPLGATGRKSVSGLDPAGTSVKLQSTNALALSIALGVPASFTQDTYIIATCSVVNSTNPGFVTLRWAQNTATGTTSVLDGSYLVAHKL